MSHKIQVSNTSKLVTATLMVGSLFGGAQVSEVYAAKPTEKPKVAQKYSTGADEYQRYLQRTRSDDRIPQALPRPGEVYKEEFYKDVKKDEKVEESTSKFRGFDLFPFGIDLSDSYEFRAAAAVSSFFKGINKFSNYFINKGIDKLGRLYKEKSAKQKRKSKNEKGSTKKNGTKKG